MPVLLNRTGMHADSNDSNIKNEPHEESEQEEYQIHIL